MNRGDWEYHDTIQFQIKYFILQRLTFQNIIIFLISSILLSSLIVLYICTHPKGAITSPRPRTNLKLKNG